jgi:S-DNA-T family DNA segregation ATPase FtsK/SpoIIIE
MAKQKKEETESGGTVEEKVVPPKKKGVQPKSNAGLTEKFGKGKWWPLIGLSITAFTIYLILAFISFFFTWQADYPIVHNPFPVGKCENMLGYWGARISNKFITDWFGVASFGFVFLFALIGIKLLSGKSIVPVKKSALISLFLIIWTSLTLGMMPFSSDYKFLGGWIGLFFSNELIMLIGRAGTFLLLIFSGLGFLLINNLIHFRWKAKAPAPVVPLTGVNEPAVVPDIVPPSDIPAPMEEKNIPSSPPQKVELKIIKPVEPPKEAEKPPVTDVQKSKLDVEALGEYDSKLDLSSYKYPGLELLEDYGSTDIKIDQSEHEANSVIIENTLKNFGISIKGIQATVGPTVTLYEITPDETVRISKIKSLQDNIQLQLQAKGIRIIAPMPGRGTVGIEVPNRMPGIVSIRSMFASDKFRNAGMELPLALGKTITNDPFVVDLAKLPHLLMAGATRQGKSVGLNAMLLSLLYKKHPSQLKMVLVDPKRVELSLYNKIEKYFLAKVPNAEDAIITDTKKVVHTLNSLCIEMDNRLELIKDAGARDIVEYNKKFVRRALNPLSGHKFLPYIVVVIDEFADLIIMAGKEIETPLQRLAQVARATGIHLIIATQRPVATIITGTIKANFPGRVAFKVMAKIDSRIILDNDGAEQLVGNGDLLFTTGSETLRLQCPLVKTEEVEKVIDYIATQQGYPTAFGLPEYVDESDEGGEFNSDEKDDLFEESARIIVETQQGSASLLQRRLSIGYNRAGRIVDQLHAAGIIGPNNGSKVREVMIKDPMSLEEKLRGLTGDDFQE